MNKFLLSCIAVSCLMLTACAEMKARETHVANARYKVNFQIPKTQKWDLISVEQDANGYAKSYREANAKGVTADQSFYINYGHRIHTPLLASMNEVVGAMANTGCKQTGSKMLSLTKNTLIFTAFAEHCMSGRSISQIFKVFNMMDGQYSIVYSANSNVVPAQTIQQMRHVVISAKITPI